MELKRYKAYEFGSAYVYHINEVDALIVEKDAEIARLKAENEKLNAQFYN